METALQTDHDLSGAGKSPILYKKLLLLQLLDIVIDGHMYSIIVI